MRVKRFLMWFLNSCSKPKIMDCVAKPSTSDSTSEPKLTMLAGAFYIPKERSGCAEGQDAHFICETKQTIGVADGVGGWSSKGIDAGIYARKLIANLVDEIEKYPTVANNENIDLPKILNNAYSRTNEQGSSTACLLTLKNNSLHYANVGDSGFMIIRGGAELYKSPVQTKRFNHPFQLGKSADKPKDAQVSSLPVQAGDIVILGTDGLFDNLYTFSIQEIVHFSSGAVPEQIARAIAEHAYYNSIDRSIPTPFSEASFNAGHEHNGGKTDDISVVVAFIM